MRYLAILTLLFVFAAAGPSAMAGHSHNGHHPDKEKQACGGIAGIQCKGENEYCKMKKGTCQVADNMGHCKKKPEVCTRDYRPVCGCDGKTYSNKCGAMAAGVNIDRKGKCEDEPEDNSHHDHHGDHGEHDDHHGEHHGH